MKKKVRIVATIGPASESKEMIKGLLQRGVNVFRLNLSHKEKDEIIRNVRDIRAVEKKVGKTAAIMGDLCGPKIRTSNIEGEVEIKTGEIVEIFDSPIEIGKPHAFSLNFKGMISDLKIGAEIYLNDGTPKLIVTEKTKKGVVAKVVTSGIIKSRMGFSAQGLAMKEFVFTNKDRLDLQTVIENGVDAVAVSFVQKGKDIEEVRSLMPKEKQKMIIAKIETESAVENIEEIIQAADGIMIARGDLGLAVPLGKVPHIQKRLIHLSLKYAKPVITATQMLESMTHSQLPTRAEVTDIANAILDGTDAVMLSGETARGKYPLEVIETMTKVIQDALEYVPAHDFPEDNSITDAVSASVVRIADQVKAKVIIVFTHKGTTARRIARHRHGQTILALTPFDESMHELNFTWGVHSIKVKSLKNFENLLSKSKEIVESNEFVKLSKGETYIISAGIPFGKAGATNMILVQKKD